MLCLGYDLIYTVTDGRYGLPRSHEPQRAPTLLAADVPWAKSGIVCRCPVGKIGKSVPMSRRLNRDWPCEAKGDSASIPFASSLNYSCAPVWAREDFWQLAGP